MSEVRFLQSVLAAEHAAIYGYGVAGAVLRGPDRAVAAASLTAHAQLRDRLTALISGLGAQPVAAHPAYRLPSPVTSHASARTLAAHLEEGEAGTLWDLVAASPPDGKIRSLAIGWLAQAAVRGAHWGARQALPGQPS